MSNKFYREGTGRADGVRDLFAAVAPRYDLINDLQSFGWHRLWKRRLIRESTLCPGGVALDICCGTGDLALRLAAKGWQVAGLDFSEPMLSVARQRASRRRVKAVSFVQGDAQDLPYPDKSFDLVTVGYGLRNLPDWRQGLREMHRVVRDRGQLLVLDFGKPAHPWVRAVYFAYLRQVVPVFGRLFCGDAETHAYIHESLLSYPAQNGVDRVLREMGCRDVNLINLFGGMMSINSARRASDAPVR